VAHGKVTAAPASTPQNPQTFARTPGGLASLQAPQAMYATAQTVHSRWSKRRIWIRNLPWPSSSLGR